MLSRLLAVALVIGALGVNLGAVLFSRPSGGDFQSAARNLHFILANPGLSYHDKMMFRFPDDYPKARFIVEHTGPAATVLLPVSAYHGMVTNYLIHPRTPDTQRPNSLWGGTPPGTYALIEDGWPAGVPGEVRRVSRLVATQGRLALIIRVKP